MAKNKTLTEISGNLRSCLAQGDDLRTASLKCIDDVYLRVLEDSVGKFQAMASKLTMSLLKNSDYTESVQVDASFTHTLSETIQVVCKHGDHLDLVSENQKGIVGAMLGSKPSKMFTQTPTLLLIELTPIGERKTGIKLYALSKEGKINTNSAKRSCELLIREITGAL